MIIDGYIRVSRVNEREGERLISPLVQRETIERWAGLHGAVVGEPHRSRRPGAVSSR